MGAAFQKAFDLIFYPTEYLTDIISTTLKMAFASSVLALLIGVPIGLAIASHNFRGKKAVVVLLRTLMGLPPVVIGIAVFVLFSTIGPFGALQWMFTVQIMILSQVILITPIVAGMTESAFTPITDRMTPTLKGLGIGAGKKTFLTLNEGKYQLIAVYLFAFARAISEVGAVQIVGGNILGKTRIMTTAIALNYSTGDFSQALALGIILLAISLLVNLVAGLLQWGTSPKRKFKWKSRQKKLTATE